MDKLLRQRWGLGRAGPGRALGVYPTSSPGLASLFTEKLPISCQHHSLQLLLPEASPPAPAGPPPTPCLFPTLLQHQFPPLRSILSIQTHRNLTCLEKIKIKTLPLTPTAPQESSSPPTFGVNIL